MYLSKSALMGCLLVLFSSLIGTRALAQDNEHPQTRRSRLSSFRQGDKVKKGSESMLELTKDLAGFGIGIVKAGSGATASVVPVIGQVLGPVLIADGLGDIAVNGFNLINLALTGEKAETSGTISTITRLSADLISNDEDKIKAWTKRGEIVDLASGVVLPLSGALAATPKVAALSYSGDRIFLNFMNGPALKTLQGTLAGDALFGGALSGTAVLIDHQKDKLEANSERSIVIVGADSSLSNRAR